VSPVQRVLSRYQRAPLNDAAAMPPTITDELRAMLVKRADDLEGCPAGLDEERELPGV
jgi:hypothetical protein